MKILTRSKLFKLTLLILSIPVFVFLNNEWVKRKAEKRLYEALETVPSNKVGLLLGTTKYLGNGYVNLYYQYRLEAAVALFEKGKIEYILVSGDNGRKGYNEPAQFKEDLITMGIPEERIYLDYAGFRTLDSVVRAKKIFGQKELTIISQKFHNERALYIAQNKGIEAIGFNAQDVSFSFGWRVQLRELLARTKMTLDLYLLKKQPKYLGEEIQIL